MSSLGSLFNRHGKLLSLAGAVAMTAAGFAFATSPAFGKEPPAAVVADAALAERSVGYGDLNLMSAKGEANLNRRVRSAVMTLCADPDGGAGNSFVGSEAATDCRNAAWRQARPQIARAVERARHIALTGKSVIAPAEIRIAIPK